MADSNGIQINPYLPLDEPSSLQPSALGPGDDPSKKFAVAGMGFSILGGLLKGMADIQSAGNNADIARQNARLALLAGGDAITRGQTAAAYALLRGSQLEGKQKAAYSGAGVSVNSGSALDVLGDTKMISDLDAKIIQNNSYLEARGYRIKADQFNQQAAIEESTGRQRAGSDILAGITGAAGYASKMIEFG